HPLQRGWRDAHSARSPRHRPRWRRPRSGRLPPDPRRVPRRARARGRGRRVRPDGHADMTTYFVGDRPGAPLTIGVPAGWDASTFYLDGTPLDTTLDGTTATATWPGNPFPAEGIYPVTVRVEGEATSQTLTADAIVAEAPSGWHTLASARAEW